VWNNNRGGNALSAIVLGKRAGEMRTFTIARIALLGATISTGVGIGYAIGAQPDMGASIALLQSAHGELQGHRERAIGLIDQAIGEVRAGIAFAGG
jgi:hypothetical protein